MRCLGNLLLDGTTIVDMYARLALEMDVVRQADWPDGPKIVAANHPTTTDPFFLLTAVPERMSVLVTGMAFDVPVFGDYLRAAEHIPVVHGKGRTALEQASRQLEGGRTIGIFPEGALSPLGGGPGFHRAHTGAVRLSLRLGLRSSRWGFTWIRRAFTMPRSLQGIDPRRRVGIQVDPMRLRWVSRSTWMERSTIGLLCGLHRGA